MKKILVAFVAILISNFVICQSPGITNGPNHHYYNVIHYGSNWNECDEGIVIKTRIPVWEEHSTTIFIKGFIFDAGYEKLVDLKVHISGSISGGFNFLQANNTGNFLPKIEYGEYNDGLDYMWISLKTQDKGNSLGHSNLKITALSNSDNLGNEAFSNWIVDCVSGYYGINIITYSKSKFTDIESNEIFTHKFNTPFAEIGLLNTNSIQSEFASDLRFGTNYTEKARILSNGNFGIGLINPTQKLHVIGNGIFTGKLSIGTTTSNPNYSLIVDGTISTRKLRVNTTPWADFVFYKNYKLMPLTKLEQYIKTNKHLPDIPTTEEVQKDGVDIGEIQAKLLQKVEELTLYVIEQDKKIKQLESQIKSKKRK